MSVDANARSARFRDLHRGAEVLTLPNVWDAATAVVVANAGAQAIATTSAGLAWSRGYPDGSALPVGLLLFAVADIVRVSRVPVSIDIEDGYSQDAEKVAELADLLWSTGVSGINLEDGARSPEHLADKIAAIRRRLTADRPLFVNARTDVYLCGLGGGDRVGEVLHRAEVYAAAGADGLFVPALANLDEIRQIADGIAPLPLNVMAVPGLPDRAELAQAGVRRLSLGSALAQASLALVGRGASAFLETGRSAALFEERIADYGKLNGDVGAAVVPQARLA